MPPHRPLSPVFGGEGKSEGPAPVEPALVTRTYDLLLWFVNHVGKFPKSHRYVLGERIETAVLNTLLLLVEAAYTREKIPLLERANLELEKLRFLIRIGKDLGFTSLKQYEYASAEVVGLGQQVGGWLRQQRRRG
jgi:hypothetical protein